MKNTPLLKRIRENGLVNRQTSPSRLAPQEGLLKRIRESRLLWPFLALDRNSDFGFNICTWIL
jgi:hypothetical protein